MGRSARIVISLAIMALSAVCPVASLADDSGLLVEASVEKRLDKAKRASVGANVEMRTRNDFRTMDRVVLDVVGKYKVLSWLRFDAGYRLLIENNEEKVSYKADGDYNNWRPSYWGTRHRVIVSATASLKVRRVQFSLRERWQFTHRPSHATTRYDFDNREWEPTTVASKNSHVLRSKLQVEWNIPKSKFTPWVSAELFNDSVLDKLRLQAGVDYTYKKRHTFTLSFRHQWVFEKDDSGEDDTNLVGLGYKYKF
ncbi:MAG: DUF2490 domain-containing protein [Muribaculaceae bacterium]|nr:DUF2490 domain-containing protein [Muribaculaceae bacterium]